MSSSGFDLGGLVRSLADRLDFRAGDANHEAAVGDERVGAAEGLGDRRLRALRHEDLLPARDHDRFGVAAEGDFFSHGLRSRLTPVTHLLVSAFQRTS